MRQPDDYPKTLVDLLLSPDRDEMVAKLFEMKKALENAVVVFNGVKHPLRISPQNAVVDLDDTATFSTPVHPDAPVLSLIVDDPNDEMDLSWTLPESYDSLHLERSDDGGVTYAALIDLAAGTTTHSDDTATLEVEYFYRVRGKIGTLFSDYSNVVNGTLAANPPATGYALLGTGANGGYQLGDGTTTSPDDFTSLSGDTFISAAGGLNHSLRVKSDGTLWSCGTNTYGQCGDGSSGNNVTTWTQVGTDTDWLYVRAGSTSSMGVKTNGAVYTWGRNNLGQLGLGDNTNRLSPTQCGSGSTWIFANMSEFNVLLVKNDNTLWMAGWGTQNQIGDGGASSRNALTQTTGTGFAKAYAGRDFAFGIKTDGKLYAWGANNYGQLGLNSISGNFSSPQSVDAATNWKSVSAGESFAIATKTDGTIYVAGTEISGGELGLGATTDTGLVFVQIGSDTNWDSTSSGPSSTLALKTTGAVYGWGYNGDGGLGVGDTTARDVPTQESSTATTWEAVAHASGYHGLALQTV